MVAVKDTSEGVAFAVKVHPRARKNAITGVVGDALKLSLTAPPVEGRANEAVVQFFADFFEIPRASVTIASGETSRRKVVRVRGVSRQAIEHKLAQI
jgi:uncharacterized protein (TIGR00251 family)